MAMNSEQKVDDSTVFWRFEKKTMGALFTKMRIPVCDLLVTLHPAWSASTKHEVVTEFPRVIGALDGIGSAASESRTKWFVFLYFILKFASFIFFINYS